VRRWAKMLNRKLLIFLVLVIVIVGCLRQPESPEVSREEATEIIIEEIATPSEAPYGLRIHLYPELLPKGSIIVPFAQWTRGEKEFIECEEDCWFFWFDYDPLAQFAHKTLYVLVNASTGEVTTKEAEWWPVINGEVVWGKTTERASDELLVYEEKVELELPSHWKHGLEFESLLQAGPGCEAWAVLVCGSNDSGNTFDEDVRFLYTVLTNLGYADDHIFYISPYTTDPGVDMDCTVANVQWAANQVAANSDAEDKVFFYYSAHGAENILQCCPGWISSTDMDNWLDAISACEIIVMLQGCRTGSFIGAYWDGTVVAEENELTGDGETNRIVMTATDTEHPSYGDGEDWGSTFTGGYIKSFSDPNADVDNNNAISVYEAYTYAVDHDSAADAGWSFPQIDPTSLNTEDVFHTCPGADVWISDGPSDFGNNSHDYNSTDIWSTLIPTGTVHEDPVSGLHNHVHVRVHNLGGSPASNVDVTLYWADTNTGPAWPTDFNQIGTTYTIPNIPAGGSVFHTWSWYVDPDFGTGHHFCFVATAHSIDDPMTGGPGNYVAPYDNNIAQKNITIVGGKAGQALQTWFFIENNMEEPIPFDLVINRSDFPMGELIFFLPPDLTEIFLKQPNLLEGFEVVERKGQEMPGLLVTAKEKAAIQGIELKPMERRKVTLEITIPEEAEVGEEFVVRIEEVAKDEVIGAVTFLVRVVPPGDCASILKRAAEVYAQIAQEYRSEAASRLVKLIERALQGEICSDPEALLEWKRKIFLLEEQVGEELKGQVPGEALDNYFRAIDSLAAALEAGDLEKIMLAQESVVDAAAKFITDRSMPAVIFSSIFYFFFFFSFSFQYLKHVQL
jgi:hypothetical protein